MCRLAYSFVHDLYDNLSDKRKPRLKTRRTARSKARGPHPHNRPKWFAVCDAVGRDIVERQARARRAAADRGRARPQAARQPAFAARGLARARRQGAGRDAHAPRHHRAAEGVLGHSRSRRARLDGECAARSGIPDGAAGIAHQHRARGRTARRATRFAAAGASRSRNPTAGWRHSLPDDLEGCCQHDLDLHEGIIAAAGNVFLARFAAP